MKKAVVAESNKLITKIRGKNFRHDGIFPLPFGNVFPQAMWWPF